jgi:hypothetical protein
MPKFRISYTTEDWWRLEVEAADIDEAMDKFHAGEYNHDDAVLKDGGYLQDSVDIRPLED